MILSVPRLDLCNLVEGQEREVPKEAPDVLVVGVEEELRLRRVVHRRRAVPAEEQPLAGEHQVALAQRLGYYRRGFAELLGQLKYGKGRFAEGSLLGLFGLYVDVEFKQGLHSCRERLCDALFQNVKHELSVCQLQ